MQAEAAERRRLRPFSRRDREAPRRAVGIEAQDTELRVLLVPEADDGDEPIAVRLCELHLPEVGRPSEDPGVDDPGPANQSELDFGARRVDDDSEAPGDASLRLRSEELLHAGQWDAGGPGREPHLRRIPVHERPRRSGPHHVGYRLGEWSSRHRRAGGRKRSNDRRSRGLEDIDRPVGGNGQVAFAACEVDRRMDRLLPATQPDESVVDLVEDDDGPVGSYVEGRWPDAGLLTTAVEADRLVAPPPPERRQGRRRGAKRTKSRRPDVDGRPAF